MKASTLLPFAILARHAMSQMLGYDPRSAADCVMWADIEDASVDTCEKTLREWKAEPKRFHAWNPSVGLDCKPWRNQTSYCVLTQETIDNSVNYTTSTVTNKYYTATFALPSYTTDSDGWTIPVTKSDAVTRAYTTIPPVPSVSTWKYTGCYIDLWNDNLDNGGNATWNLDYRFIPRDPAETVDKCKQKCWEIRYRVAGLKLGNECFCGNRNNATLAEDQNECDIPCVGDANVKCGGTQRMNVWAADEASTGGTLTTASRSGASATRTGAGAATETATSGARRNAALFWM
ncbi:uncharacterized protein M421DRAFT_420450 [Didymella exigua CBS 183.55]|uniref:WSC domain-containing protein n=1 Tax=Didymella exigua CBS 183.55 TaxID=1150837 RepID=A0A6A5RM89_9PLEO|nr:uncharacterized protein M421DRAFT_420450 [Didymella exigua CBS 183.55]KAF1928563.1 hypothetical protein M421DRAFT_420450 [Didymella exigua CBS 183.55]